MGWSVAAGSTCLRVRWLFIHGRDHEAEKVVADIESRVSEDEGVELVEPNSEPLDHPGENVRGSAPFRANRS